MSGIDDGALARLRAAVREPDLAGTRYRLLGLAGTGGMGSVYVVEDAALARRIALKVLEIEDAETATRLRNEARILARLEHPGIVPVHEVGTLADGRTYYTMKLVEGERLDRYAMRGTPIAERLRVFLRIAEAVAFAHTRGVLHRDLKPQNVMVGPFGEVLVMDWGLAKVLSETADAPPTSAMAGRRGPGETAEGAVLGTPGFMSPEQQAGASGSVDARADVFSLGAVLRWLAQEPLSAPLAAIARKAMAEPRDDRYADVPSLARDVASFLDGGPVSAYPEGLARRALRLATRHRVALGIVLAYLVLRALIVFAGR